MCTVAHANAHVERHARTRARTYMSFTNIFASLATLPLYTCTCVFCVACNTPLTLSVSLAPNKTQEEIFKKREEALKMKDLELQESLIRFSKFLQENDSKRARAEKKVGW